MLTVYPEYYPAFRCAAEKCLHTCCAGWEIDVDPDSRALYETVPGPLGDKLRRVMDDEPTPHFILTEDERCPFLTERNLCELILARGDESLLCRICRDHPRWRTFLPGRTETGVGLCCEAAARLILTRTGPVSLICVGVEDPEDENARALLQWREALLSAARDRAFPLPARLEEILELCAAALPFSSMKLWASFLRGLEQLDPAWTEHLDRLEREGDLVDITTISDPFPAGFEQLLVYFLHRHFLKAYDDGDAAGKAAFAVLSTRVVMVLYALHPAPGPEALLDLARMYSAEIEYSEENLNALYDALCPETPWED